MSSPNTGHIELERSIDSIKVGYRHRKDLGDIDALAKSIADMGLLQPVTVTPDGVLVCGLRRLEAMRRLGRRTLKVWVRSGISDQLALLLAQQEENEQHKPLEEVEQALLHRELKELMAEDAQRRQAATRFGGEDAGEVSGAAAAAAPQRGSGDIRRQAANVISGKSSYTRHEQVARLHDLATSNSIPPAVKELASQALAQIKTGEPIKPLFNRVMAALELAQESDAGSPSGSCATTADDLAALAAEAQSRVRQEDARSGLRALQHTKGAIPAYRSLRSFILTWTELEGWTQFYDVEEIARDLKEAEWERFERVLVESMGFAERVREARNAIPVPA